jgi:microcystin-dependent protein
MSDPFVSQIMIFGGNYVPKGWLPCNGSLVQISQFQALFSLLGTTYGGDGQTTFGLPDLRGRAPVNAGASPGPGLAPYIPGQMGGAETVSITSESMAAHSHAVKVSANNEAATITRPGGAILGTGAIYEPAASADANLGGVSGGKAGGSQPHENRMPYIAMNYIICYEGIYPSHG